MKSKRPIRPAEPAETGYPERGTDRSRRRFLRQISAGAGAAGFLSAFGLPKLGHGQSDVVDFSVLDAHPHAGEVLAGQAGPPAGEMLAFAAPPSPAAPPAASRPAPTPAAAPPAQAAEPVEAAEPTAASAADAPPAEPVATIVENRALWLESGYLLLLRWERPEELQGPVAALEGSTDAVTEILTREVQASSDLHNIDRLHAIEAAILALLEPMVAPATIEVLHLNHDCNVVCSGFPTVGTPPDTIPLAGVAPPTSW